MIKKKERQAVVDRLKGRFNTLKYLGNQPNLHTYNELIYNSMAVGHADQAKYFYEAMVAQNLTPDLETFALMLGTCAFSNNALRAALFLQDMSASNILPTKPFFETAASIFKSAGYSTQASVFDGLAKQSSVSREEFDSALGKLGDLTRGEK
jgi:pentatricopeptide repeat protein